MNESKVSNKSALTKASQILFVLLAAVCLLVLGKDILIPIAFSLLIWFLMRKVRLDLSRKVFRNKLRKPWLLTLLTSVLFIGILIGLGIVIRVNMETIYYKAGAYTANIDKILKQFQLDKLKLEPETVRNFIQNNIQSTLKVVGNSFGNLLIIVMYLLFIISEERTFQTKLGHLFENKRQLIASKIVFEQIEESITNYIGMKSLIALIAAILSYVILICFGIDGAFFWTLLIFILNFIPTIGALISPVLPACYALVQFGDPSLALWLFLSLGLLLGIIGNILEPKILGKSLNLSPLATFVALIFWGSIWGQTGMFLSVPITVFLMIVFSKFQGTRSIAILLSESGNI
jgi:AI-2 transport protein TqsA